MAKRNRRGGVCFIFAVYREMAKEYGADKVAGILV